LAERCGDALILIIRDTLGPWSDFIKEFGFVLPKPSKGIQSVTKMQMWAHESRSAPFGGAT